MMLCRKLKFYRYLCTCLNEFLLQVYMYEHIVIRYIHDAIFARKICIFIYVYMYIYMYYLRDNDTYYFVCNV